MKITIGFDERPQVAEDVASGQANKVVKVAGRIPALQVYLHEIENSKRSIVGRASSPTSLVIADHNGT